MAHALAVKRGFFPLDRELGLRPNERWSRRASDLIVRIGTELPFERGPELLALTTGMRVSVSTVRTMTEAAEQERIMRTLPGVTAGAPRQPVSIDGAMVPLRHGIWREVRMLVIGAIETTASEPHTTDHRYFSRMTNAEAFAEQAVGEIHRRGTERAGVVAEVADGALWCQQFMDDHLPNAVRILDFPHAVGHLSMVAQAVFGSGTEATGAWLGLQRHALRTGNPDSVLTAIADLPVATASDPLAAAAIRDREHAYFSTRRDQITYPTFVAAGLSIGSGAVESANKLVVEARLKGAGMHWAAHHVDPMLALRCALCSNRGDEWRQRARRCHRHHVRQQARNRGRCHRHRRSSPRQFSGRQWLSTGVQRKTTLEAHVPPSRSETSFTRLLKSRGHPRGFRLFPPCHIGHTLRVSNRQSGPASNRRKPDVTPSNECGHTSHCRHADDVHGDRARAHRLRTRQTDRDHWGRVYADW